MKTTAIKIEGQIISPEIFDKLDSGGILGQTSRDFGFEDKVKIKEEIQRVWAYAKEQWNKFKQYTENIPPNETGTTETRKFWIIPLLNLLNYNLTQEKAEYINDRSYAISHRDQTIDGFPIHIIGFNDSLDKKRENFGTRLSPHALVQEYLNVTEHLYGIVTNGYKLRLLRDSGRLVRLSYLEFDLQKMMEEDLYAEFSIFYRLIHKSRMPQKVSEGDSSIIEQYHQYSLEAGARIRDKLSYAVEQSIVVLANGFLSNPNNVELIKQIKEGKITENNLYQLLLRLIYRILFLMVLEERDLLFDNNGESKYYKEIYYKFYSIQRLRKLSEKIYLFDETLSDLWISLKNTFKIFSNELLASKIKLYPLNGDLFDYNSIGILAESNIDNRSLLECIKSLNQFEDESTGSIIKVNYAALNVEEFGSVYEGLLEKAPLLTFNGQKYTFSFVEGDERATSGSHYTPEELVQPLIKHSLDYVIQEKLKSAENEWKKSLDRNHESLIQLKENNILSIKVCDVACGSGHILLSAARRIAVELAKVRTGEEQPSPEPYRQAIRDVINSCIYGVDKNPLAVELCKVALWLEAHNPGMPLNFLDHKIKCGDSIVGLARIEELQNGIATEAFKTLPGDDKDIAAAYRKQNKSERENRAQLKLTDTEEIINNLNTISVMFKNFNLLPDTTVDEVKKKQQEYNLLKGNDWWKLKELADLQVAQFFIEKTENNKELLTTDAEYFRIFAGQKKEVSLRKVSHAMAIAVEKKFFHWFLEFPEVMQEGGFDCILGNPPFLGGQKLSGTFGEAFLNWVKTEYAPAGSCDLVTYFFRRIYELLKPNGFQALLATNTIAQGNAREGGLDVILKKGGNIIFAIRSMKWPGEAGVQVSLVSIYKGEWKRERFLGNKKVSYISSYLDDSKDIGNPFPLKQNEGKSFQGSIVLGKGFILTPEKAKELIDKDPRNKDVLFPYLNGDDLNSNPDQSPSRWVINFFDWPLRRATPEEWSRLSEAERHKINKEGIIAPPDYKGKVATDYPDCLAIVERDVKPERTRWKNDKNGNDIIGKYALRKPLPQKWWIYAEKRPALYSSIKNLKNVLGTVRISKFLNVVILTNDQVFNDKAIILALPPELHFPILQSSINNEWSWKNSTTLGGSTIIYTPGSCFDTFPFPQTIPKETESELEKIGKEYHEFRRQLMLDMQLGLTKTYNLFHNPNCNSNNLEKAKFIKEFKQAKLQIPIEEAVKRIEKLRELHRQMDETVLKAYGWTDINLEHNFYEVEYLPENDRIRFTISLEARKEILKRLLDLNHKIHEEEVKAGLWDKNINPRKKKNNRLSVEEPSSYFNHENIFND